MGWAVRLAKHLEALHQHGVAHGNVSPACVLIENNDPRSRGMVADVRRTAEMIQYHSPERFRDGQLTPADDTWGVAATLFTVLTVARPFGEVRQEILTRLPHGVPALTHYRLQEEGLQQILSAALAPDPQQRIGNVTHLRQHLERWFNDPAILALKALEDEEGGEEDQAATAMLAMDQMFDERPSGTPMASKPSIPDSGLFAPASFAQTADGRSPSLPDSTADQLTGRRGPPPPVPPMSPLGEQDATVMRELPAHIMAMAARAAAGGSDPPPPPAEPADDDTGGATRVGNTADIAAAMNRAQEAPVPQQPPRPPPPPSHPGGPTSPRPRPPRAIRSTQLGVGSPLVPPVPPAAPPLPAGPRSGFAPPPATVSSAPPPHDPDDIRTMHGPIDALINMGETAPRLASQLQQQAQQHHQQQQPAPEAQAAEGATDDDDGGRTVLRDAPSFDEFFRPPQDAQAPQAQWKPAAPPVQPRAFAGSTERPQAGPPPAAGGVSALIQETLENMQPGQPHPGPGLAQPAPGPPPGFPMPMEPTGGYPNLGQQAGPPVAGPFQPLSAAGQGPSYGAPQQGPFTPVGLHGGGPSDPGVQPFLEGLAAGPQDASHPGAYPGEPLAQPGGYPVGAGMGGYPDAQPPSKKKGSKLGLFIVCLLVLILAAALTFIFLRYRHMLDFLPPELRGAPPG